MYIIRVLYVFYKKTKFSLLLKLYISSLYFSNNSLISKEKILIKFFYSNHFDYYN